MKRAIIALVAVATISTSAQAYNVPAFLRGPLRCAENTIKFLGANGIHVPHNRSSKWVFKYRRIPKSQARLGDVHFTYRRGGGHDQPVTANNGGDPLCLNPSQHHGQWQKPNRCKPGGMYFRIVSK